MNQLWFNHIIFHDFHGIFIFTILPPTYLPAYLPTYLPTYLLTYLPYLPVISLSIVCMFPWFMCTAYHHQPQSHDWMYIARRKLNKTMGPYEHDMDWHLTYGCSFCQYPSPLSSGQGTWTSWRPCGTSSQWLSAQSLHQLDQPSQCIHPWLSVAVLV